MRPSLLALATVVAVAGVWQAGQGAWVYGKARLAQLLLQRAWARTVAGDLFAQPWPWADMTPIARLRAPAHGVDVIVLSDVSGRTLAFGPGHVPGTAVPGAPGTAVVSGHRDTHFSFLRRVATGDELIVETAGRAPRTFRVRETAVVDARRGTIAADGDGTSLVLVTCWPFDALVPGGPMRYVVVAEVSDRQASARRRTSGSTGLTK